jgi:hypothetical protein
MKLTYDYETIFKIPPELTETLWTLMMAINYHHAQGGKLNESDVALLRDQLNGIEDSVRLLQQKIDGLYPKEEK